MIRVSAIGNCPAEDPQKHNVSQIKTLGSGPRLSTALGGKGVKSKAKERGFGGRRTASHKRGDSADRKDKKQTRTDRENKGKRKIEIRKRETIVFIAPQKRMGKVGRRARKWSKMRGRIGFEKHQ